MTCATKCHTVAVPDTCSKCQGHAVFTTQPVNSEFPDSPDPDGRASERVEAVPVGPRGDVPGSAAWWAVRVAGRGAGSAARGAGRGGSASRGAGDLRSGGRRTRGDLSGCVVPTGAGVAGGLLAGDVDRSRASPGGEADEFYGGAEEENGTTMGGELMGESEIEALDADVTRLAVEVAELAELMGRVTREVKSLLGRPGLSAPASA